MAGSKITDYMAFTDNDLLASTVGFEPISIMIDAAALDADNPSGVTTHLRKGLALCPLTATGKYIAYTGAAVDGSGDAAETVILFQDIELDGTNDAVAVAIFKGTVKLDKVIADAGLDWSACQRISRLKQTQSGY